MSTTGEGTANKRPTAGQLSGPFVASLVGARSTGTRVIAEGASNDFCIWAGENESLTAQPTFG